MGQEMNSGIPPDREEQVSGSWRHQVTSSACISDLCSSFSPGEDGREWLAPPPSCFALLLNLIKWQFSDGILWNSLQQGYFKIRWSRYVHKTQHTHQRSYFKHYLLCVVLSWWHSPALISPVLQLPLWAVLPTHNVHSSSQFSAGSVVQSRALAGVCKALCSVPSPGECPFSVMECHLNPIERKTTI